jgi:hypothetical protein
LAIYAVFAGGIIAGANDPDSWWFRGTIIFSAIIIGVATIYDLKNMAKLERSVETNTDDITKLRSEITSLKDKIRSLEDKATSPSVTK